MIGQRKGFRHSEESKRKIAEARKGQEMSEHTKKLMRKVAKKNPHAYKKGNVPWIRGKKLPQMAQARIGQGNPNWRGGIKIEGGYVVIYSPLHPNHKQNYVKRANLVMEGIIGRYLVGDEMVHHKNRNRQDDRPNNLQLCANKSEHMKIHRKEGL